MAGIFTIFSLAIFSALCRQRVLALSLAIIGLVACMLMFWHHATDILKINL